MFSPAYDRAAHRPLRALLREAALTVVAFVTLDDGRASTGTDLPVHGGAHEQDRPIRRGRPAPAPGAPSAASAGAPAPPVGARRRFGRTSPALAARQGHPHHRPLAGPPAHRRPATGEPLRQTCTAPVAPQRSGAPLRPARLVWTRTGTRATPGCRTHRAAA